MGGEDSGLVAALSDVAPASINVPSGLLHAITIPLHQDTPFHPLVESRKKTHHPSKRKMKRKPFLCEISEHAYMEKLIIFCSCQRLEHLLACQGTGCKKMIWNTTHLECQEGLLGGNLLLIRRKKNKCDFPIGTIWRSIESPYTSRVIFLNKLTLCNNLQVVTLTH